MLTKSENIQNTQNLITFERYFYKPFRQGTYNIVYMYEWISYVQQQQQKIEKKKTKKNTDRYKLH